MQKYLFAILAILSSASAWGSEPVSLDACALSPFSQSAGTTRNGSTGFAVFKRVCYVDASGSYVLNLLVDKDSIVGRQPLSEAVQIQLFKLSDGAHLQLMARDARSEYEAGMEFLPKLIDVSDIDGDGLIDPIIVYRFYTSDDDSQGSDNYSGRIKIIMFYKGQKVAIRAVTGLLDGSRSTTASSNFFKLPKKVQNYLVKKMERMYYNGQFGFDNTFGFNPRRE